MVVVDLEFEKFLGEGAFGTVSLYKYKRQHEGDTLYAAVKTSEEKHAKTLYKEFQILSEFKGCPRIVQFYGNGVQEIVNKKGNVEYKIAIEYAAEGSLSSFMERFQDGKLPEPMIKEFTRMLLEGLATIHQHGYVHCDLKPENILVFPTCVYKNGAWIWSYELKISDFGMSKKVGDSKWWQPRQPYAGTPIYMSPESISHGEIGKGLDIWSLGCVVLEMYTGKKPWWHTNFDLKDLKKCYEPLIPRELSCKAKLFLMTCFAFEQNERKEALRLLKHSFVREDVNKFTKLQVDVKIDKSKEIILKLDKMTQLLKEIRSMG